MDNKKPEAVQVPFLSVVLCLILALILVAGCGAKADPKLPEVETNPFALTDLKGHGPEGKFELSWFAPKEVPADKSIVSYRIYRKQWPEGDKAQAKSFMLGEIKISQVATKEQKRLFFFDKSIKTGLINEYHLFCVYNDNTLGPDNVFGPFKAEFPSLQVSELTAVSYNGAAYLTWKSLDGSSALPGEKIDDDKKTDLAVNVYRADGAVGSFPSIPVNSDPVLENKFVDSGVTPETTYRYKARTLRVVNDVVLEGVFSSEISIKVIDKTAPEKAMVLWTKAIDGGIRLRWKAPDDPGLLGFSIFRRLAEDSEIAALLPPKTEEPVAPESELEAKPVEAEANKTEVKTTTSETPATPALAPEKVDLSKYQNVKKFITVDEYTDKSIVDNGVYVYLIEARDKAGNQSFSIETAVQYPAPKPVEPAPEEAIPAEEPTPEVLPVTEETPKEDSTPVEEEPKKDTTNTEEKTDTKVEDTKEAQTPETAPKTEPDPDAPIPADIPNGI